MTEIKTGDSAIGGKAIALWALVISPDGFSHSRETRQLGTRNPQSPIQRLVRNLRQSKT